MKYWKSTKDSSLVKQRRKDLQVLIFFVNVNLSSLGPGDLRSLKRALARFQRVKVKVGRFDTDRPKNDLNDDVHWKYRARSNKDYLNSYEDWSSWHKSTYRDRYDKDSLNMEPAYYRYFLYFKIKKITNEASKVINESRRVLQGSALPDPGPHDSFLSSKNEKLEALEKLLQRITRDLEPPPSEEGIKSEKFQQQFRDSSFTYQRMGQMKDQMREQTGGQSRAEKKANELKLLSEVQARLRFKMETIMKSAQMGDKKVLSEIPGIRKALVSTSTRFAEEFQVEIPSSDPIEREMVRLEIVLLDALRDLDLRPNRFRTCSRCGNYYYQPTARDKGYCSNYCGSAVRYKRFMEKKKEKNEIYPSPRADDAADKEKDGENLLIQNQEAGNGHS